MDRYMNRSLNFLAIVLGVSTFTSCDIVENFEHKMSRIERYENVSLFLSQENRTLKAQVSELKSQLQVAQSEKNYLKGQLAKYEKPKSVDRGVASNRAPVFENDLVQYDVYKWSPDQMMAMAEKEFASKNYEKSAQFYRHFIYQFPKHESIDDKFLFKAGVAAFESGKHHDWTIRYLDRLVTNYPTSSLYRGAKLWMALTHLKLGEHDKFFSTVEEFRKKYRNTDEWEILSHQYETIVQKYKRN